MTYAGSLAALQGLFVLLLGVLTIVYTHSSSQRDGHGVFLAESRLIRRPVSSRPPDKSKGWSFVPRDYLSNEVLYERLVDEDDNPSSISATGWNGTSAYEQIGTSGVAVMQMSVVDDQYVIFFDKAEHNPLLTSDGNNAWSALLDTHAHTVRALKLITNSFCAGEKYLCLYHVSVLSPIYHWPF
jgi:hypothetical protein